MIEDTGEIMNKFEILFGVKESQIKSTCIIMPFLKKGMMKDFGIKQFSKGRLYGTGNSELFTLIQTGMGSALAGDAVLYLNDTSCKNIILFGSCGLTESTKDIKLGSLITSSKCHSMESFTEILSGCDRNRSVSYPDKDLLDGFLKINREHVKKAACASVGSLVMEERNIDLFRTKGIRIVDMECSAVFSASKHIGCKAISLFYVSDILIEKPFYIKLNKKEEEIINSSTKNAVRILCDFIKKLSL
ncbi:hypothetical protein KAI19_05535 [bacterium]|nr:hypothetical protein [bacterium]